MKLKLKALSFSLAVSFGAVLTAGTAQADTAAKVTQWFNNMDYANVTGPGIYEGQTARYATLGGISTRAPITQPFNFINVQTPKFSAGCGGIDFYSGGFSAINANQFVQNLRAIGQNAQSLAFMLAIQIVSPQLSGVMEDINTWAQKLNALNMDSCDAATQLVGGAMDFFGAKEENCTIKRMNDFGEDWNVANYNCTTGGEIKNTESAGASPNAITFAKGNLAWSVLMQDPLFSNDLEFAEMILNITGTIIITDSNGSDDSESTISFIDPTIDDNGAFTERGKNIYTALLLGNDATVNIKYYRCDQNRNADPDGCTRMTNNLQDLVPGWQGLTSRVRDEIVDIVDKIYNDQPLNNVQLGIVRSTRIPLYKYLAVTAAYFPRGFNVGSVTNDYTDLIAEDILLRNLSAVIEKARQAISSMPNDMGASNEAKDFHARLDKILKGIGKLKDENNNDADLYFAMQGRIQNYERAIMSRLNSGMVQSAMWGR
jgi:conjugative transfer pilus assembly protein TraH